ncbi:MAG: hypothetical protein GWO87_02740 [Xanthomonadaceae bacterium]|nr:hypothetical protein [Rhodospirillaceae bacterium]NIA18079.1 hypothetical protein [Xanthomonadaceae bacterium]
MDSKESCRLLRRAKRQSNPSDWWYIPRIACLLAGFVHSFASGLFTSRNDIITF